MEHRVSRRRDGLDFWRVRWVGDRRMAGFSLIELLLVTVIALMLSGVAIPLFVRSFESTRMNMSARAVHRMHRYARARALLSASERVLRFDLERGRIELLSAPVPKGPEPALEKGRALERGIRLVRVELPEGDVTNGRAEVRYNRSGRCLEYAVELRDADGRGLRVAVDGISGEFEVRDADE